MEGMIRIRNKSFQSHTTIYQVTTVYGTVGISAIARLTATDADPCLFRQRYLPGVLFPLNYTARYRYINHERETYEEEPEPEPVPVPQ